MTQSKLANHVHAKYSTPCWKFRQFIYKQMKISVLEKNFVSFQSFKKNTRGQKDLIIIVELSVVKWLKTDPQNCNETAAKRGNSIHHLAIF